jgi:tetratricopeptide (TPR) repeat protein
MLTQRTLWLIAVCLCLFSTACGPKNVPVQPPHQKAAIRDLIEGNTWYMRGCYDKASMRFEKALERFSAGDDLDGVAKCLNNLGSLYRAQKDPDTALLFFGEAERTFRNIGQALGQIQALSNTAAVYIDMNRLEDAEAVLNQADDLARQQVIAYTPLWSNRALLYIRQGKPADARPLMDQALLQVSETSPFQYATAHHVAGLLMEALGENDKALEHFNQALETDRREDFMRGMADDLTAMGRVYQAMDKHQKAVDTLYRSLKILTLLRDPAKAETTSSLLKISLEALGKNAPDMRITDVYLKRWAEGDMDSPPCD